MGTQSSHTIAKTPSTDRRIYRKAPTPLLLLSCLSTLFVALFSAAPAEAAESEIIATRVLPKYFVPQEQFAVSIDITPQATVVAWALEETPPAGWTVSDISVGGLWSASDAKIKWGPFFNATPRVFTYKITPPQDATGDALFTGLVSADGLNETIVGKTSAALAGLDVTITSPLPDPTTAELIPVTVTFSDAAFGFTSADLEISSATLQNFSGAEGDSVFTFDLKPEGITGVVTVDIADDAAQNASGGGSQAAPQFSRTYSIPLTLALTSSASEPTYTSPIPVVATFNQPVADFIQADLLLINATVVDFTAVSPEVYTFGLEPVGDGVVRADIAAGSAHNAIAVACPAASISRYYAAVPSLPSAPSLPNPPDGAQFVPLDKTLNWRASAGASTVDIYLWEASVTKPATPTASPTEPTYTPASPLEYATTYKWQVVARNAEGATEGPIWTFTTIEDLTDREPPQIIVGPFVSSITNNSALVEWRTNEPTTSRVAYGAPEDAVVEGYRAQHSVLLTGLAPSTAYEIYAQSTDEAGNGPVVSDPVAFTTLDTADTQSPYIVEGPVVNHITVNSAMIEWTTNEPATSIVDYGASVTLGSTIASDAYLVQHQIPIEGLIPGATYYFKATSVDLADNAPVVSRVLSFSTLVEPDRDPPIFTGGPVVVAVTDSKAILQWATSEPTVASIYYDDGTSMSVMQDSTFAFEHTICLTGLTSKTLYSCVVAATDSAGNGPVLSKTLKFKTATLPDTSPPRITEPAVELQITHELAIVHWFTDELADSVVHYGLSPDALDQTVSVAELSRSHSVNLIGLIIDQPYFYKVFSTDSSGNGPTASTPRQFTTDFRADTFPPTIITGPKLVGNTDKTATLFWLTDEPSDTGLKYGLLDELMVGNFAHFNASAYSDSAQVRMHRVTLANLEPGQTYVFVVSSTDMAGNTVVKGTHLNVKQNQHRAVEPEETLTFTTDLFPDTTTPTLTTGPEIIAVTDISAIIRWTTDEVADSLLVYGPAGEEPSIIISDLAHETDHQMLVTNLAPSTTYAYRVSSTDVTGNGPVESALIEFTTADGPDTDAPLFLDGPNIDATLNQAAITWLTNEFGTSEIRYGEAPDDMRRVASTGGLHDTHGVLIANLDPGRTYYYQAFSVDPSGNKAATDQLEFQTAFLPVSLTVLVEGAGSVEKSLDRPLYVYGTTITLEATPEPGHHFSGWSGDIPAGAEMDNPLLLTLDGDKEITALFEVNPPNTHALTLLVIGNGSVTRSPDQSTYQDGALVTLQATPKTGYHFAGWSGDVPPEDETGNPLILTLDADKRVTATFEINPPDIYTLVVEDSQNGMVVKSPDQNSYEDGTPVTLQATPKVGYHFAGWSGDIPAGAEMDNPLLIIVDANKVISAQFDANPPNTYALTVIKPENGSIEKSPDQMTYEGGATVSLTPLPDEGYNFTQWTGPNIPLGHAQNNPLALTMNGDKTISADFEISRYTLAVAADHGQVEITPPGQTTYPHGSTVTLTAQGEGDYKFTHWTGDVPAGADTDTSITLVMDGDKALAAHFTAPGLAIPANLTAEDGLYPHRVRVSWEPVAQASVYRLYRSLSETGDKEDLTGWQAATSYDDTTAAPGVAYIYWVQAAFNSLGDRSGALSAPETGSTTALADLRDYKVTYKNCGLTVVDQVDLEITSVFKNASIKIKKLKEPPAKPAKLGIVYVRCATIPKVTLQGTMKKIFTEVEIGNLNSDDLIKNFTAKNTYAANINAAEFGAVKMTALADSAGAAYAPASIQTTGPSETAMKITLNGVILENLDAAQPVKYIKTASKKFKDKITKIKSVSLGGIGRAIPGAQGGAYAIAAVGLKTISAKGCSIAPDSITSLLPISTLSAKSKKLNGVNYPGVCGQADAQPLMRVLAPEFKNIFGSEGVAGVFIAGYDDEGEPNYLGSIKSIGAKKGLGALVGEAHVSPASAIKFKSEQGEFVVHTEPPPAS